MPLSNPLDPWALDEPARAFAAAIAALGADTAYDVLLAQVDLSRCRGATEQIWCAAVVHALAEQRERTGAFVALTTVHHTDPPDALAEFAIAHGVALFKGIDGGLAALRQAADWNPNLDQDVSAAPGVAVDASELEASAPGGLSEDISARLLERAGLRFAHRVRAGNPQEAAAIAEQIGFPVVVKVDGPAHKAREGGVILDLHTPEGVRDAAARIDGPVLVAEQIAPGTEVFCGMVRDPTFGPVYALGVGGSDVETTRPVTALGPLTPGRIAAMTQCAQLTPWADPIRDALLAVDAIARQCPRVSEIDVNPIICAPSGAGVAVDALVVLGPETPITTQ